jgi:hypothetical protein
VLEPLQHFPFVTRLCFQADELADDVSEPYGCHRTSFSHRRGPKQRPDLCDRLSSWQVQPLWYSTHLRTRHEARSGPWSELLWRPSCTAAARCCRAKGLLNSNASFCFASVGRRRQGDDKGSRLVMHAVRSSHSTHAHAFTTNRLRHKIRFQPD